MVREYIHSNSLSFSSTASPPEHGHGFGHSHGHSHSTLIKPSTPDASDLEEDGDSTPQPVDSDLLGQLTVPDARSIGDYSEYEVDYHEDNEEAVPLMHAEPTEQPSVRRRFSWLRRKGKDAH